MASHRRESRLIASLFGGFVLALSATLVIAGIIDLTLEDFHLPGTQIGDMDPEVMISPENCRMCHGDFDLENEPFSTWAGSLMAHAGRDPLFYAQMTLANQDTDTAGNYCLRCHVPMSFVTGHAQQVDGSTLDEQDREGVSCHFCHSLVDPIYRPGQSPPEDQAILAGLAEVPAHYANAMFVLDPSGTRRGPRSDAQAPHAFLRASFQSSSNMCGTCHEVGNVAVTRQSDGTYRYNSIGQPTDNLDPAHQFPLERTFTEWRLSDFADGGVDMHGRFGGPGVDRVSTCQDCHMPKTSAQSCFFGPERDDMRRHDFSGAAAQVLDLILAYGANDPAVEPDLIAAARARAVSMLERAASLELRQAGDVLSIRVINETGHKLPTGHIEGRRVWVNVQFLDWAGQIVQEFGRYDMTEAELDEQSTTVYEMHVGLSPFAAQITGLPAGPTGHMALADTIVKDNRIPPRGFNNAAFEGGGAPVVEHTYADGQYWDDTFFSIPENAALAEVRLFYQNTPRHYIEMLRDNNHTDHWGQSLYDAWVQTGRGAPIQMASGILELTPPCEADFDGDGFVTGLDFDAFVAAFEAGDPSADFDHDGFVTGLDFDAYVEAFEEGC